MNNYIVIDGNRHDLIRKKGDTCKECSLTNYCSAGRMPCAFFAGNDLDAIKEYCFISHSNN